MAQNNNVNSNQNQNNNVVNNAPTNSQNVDNQNASRASDAKDLASGLGGIFSGGSSRRGGNNRFMESALPRNNGNNNASSNSGKGKNPFSHKGRPSARDNINNATQRYNQAKQNANNPYKMKKGHENEKMRANASNPSKDNFKKKNALQRGMDKSKVAGAGLGVAKSYAEGAGEALQNVAHPVEYAKQKVKVVVARQVIAIVGSLFSGCMPFLLIGLVIFILLFIIFSFGSGAMDDDSGGNTVYDSACNFEETNVIVMDGNNKSVLATVSLEDYVIGVACPEIGACSGEIEKMNKEYLKAKYVAVKTYTLTRRNGYSSSNKSVTMKAATKDQQWCDLDKGCILTKTSHKVEGSNSVYLYSYPGDYNKDKVDGNVYSTLKFTDKDKELAHKYYQEIYGDLFLPTTYNKSIDTLRGESVILSYHDHTQNFWKQQAENGKMYDEILTSTATSGDSDAKHYKGKSIYKMGAYCQVSSSGDTGNLVDLGDYPSVFSKKEIRSSITSLLSSSQINEINNYIKTNVDSAGYGTGAGVAAAGQSLIAGLYQKGYFLPYYYGGGHGSLAIGVDEKWGTSVSATGMNATKGRNVYSYDCSAFVSWSIKNACKSSFSAPKSDQFVSNYGPGISLSKAKPGDLMAKSGHVRLIVKNNGDGSVITAESTSGGYKHGGIQFTKRTEAGPYTIVDMSGWYSRNCSKSR